MIREAGLPVPEALARLSAGERLFSEPHVDTGKFFIASA